MVAYSYGACLDQAHRVNWKVKDVLGTLAFDRARPWLPEALSGGPGIHCLNPEEKRRLTHVEMGAYAHLFGFVEAFIAPLMVDLAWEIQPQDDVAFQALTNFASEEVKHIHLFREIRQRVNDTLGFPLDLVGDEAEVAQAVLAKSRGAVLLLTSAIEWFTQQHYLSAMQGSDQLDPLTREIFRFHWMEEAQHARLDHLETLRFFREATEGEREQAIEDLVWLLAALDGVLQQQVVHDLANFRTYLGRSLEAPEWLEVQQHLLRAKRHCFIESGVQHPNFQELFLLVTHPSQRSRVQRALDLILRREIPSEGAEFGRDSK